MWVGGVGARLAFAVAAGNGAGPAIARFSVAHHITGSAAWVAALVMMALADVLTRLAVIYLRGRRLAAAPAAPRPASRQASVADLESRPAAVHTVSVKARLAAAGLGHGAARPGSPPAPEAARPPRPGWPRRGLAPASAATGSGRRCGRWAWCSSRWW